ncbi:MAG TPA: hypothetical protein EYP41_11000 [Anaerolineae bacterium]|nr:hypothetical protein [Anaerolineae bacterium]
MRFIVKEQRYEKPIAAGLLQYERDSRPTGAVEHWRLTQAVEGYEILRVDLDARAAPSGQSSLFHLVRQGNGRPERLNYRFWGDGLEIRGTLLFAETHVTATRTVNGETFTEETALPAGYGFWFPSTVGLGLLAGFVGGTATSVNSVQAVTLGSGFSLQVVDVRLTLGELAELEIARRVAAVRPLTIRWQDEERLIWLDEHEWPVMMRRGDGLTAVETHYIWYG